ncbi:MAG: DoxX family protein [Marinoscillum sp.]
MNANTKKIIYWIVTAITAIAFLIPGVGNLLHLAHFSQDMLQLGYPVYFSTILGIWKILGAIAIILPGLKRLKEWAYAGMLFDLTGASFSRISVQDDLIMVITPLIICLAAFSSWYLRPANRKLSPAI